MSCIEMPIPLLSAQVALANDGRVFVGDGYCNSRVLEYSAQGEWRGEFVMPSTAGQPLQNPHSIVLQECAHALYVAEREASRVHRFSLGTRELEGMCHDSYDNLAVLLGPGSQPVLEVSSRMAPFPIPGRFYARKLHHTCFVLTRGMHLATVSQYPTVVYGLCPLCEPK